MGSKTFMLNDLPIQKISDAHFGFEKYSETLVSTILGADTPLCIGIFGSWGTGKTSLMKMVYSRLDNSEYSDQIIPVWFNAWRFENEPHLILALLNVMRETVASRNKPFADYLKTFLKAVLAGIEVNAPIKPLTFTFSPAKASNEMKEISKIANTQSLYFDSFKYLEKSIKQFGDLSFVVFIDDLDRCAPDKIIQMFESIKLFMDFPGIIYVLGVDPSMLEYAVSQKYSKDSGIDGNSYIKKIIQVLFNIPKLQNDDILTFVSNNLVNLDREVAEHVARIICYGAGSNPREIKRLINSFWLRYQMNPEKLKPEKTAFFMILEQRWPQTYKSIQDDKDQFLRFCDSYEKGGLVNYEDLVSNQNNFVKGLTLGEDAWDFMTRNNIDLSFSDAEELNEYLHFTSVSSYKGLQEGELEFIQSVEKVNEKSDTNNEHQFRWKISPVASERTLQKIARIIYTLPGGYYLNPRQETTIEDGFSIARMGSSNITILIAVYLINGEVYYRSYTLNLKIT